MIKLHDQGEREGNLLGRLVGKWGPLFLDPGKDHLQIMQLVPRSHPEVLDTRLFDVEFYATNDIRRR